VTRVVVSAERAEVTRIERELDREAWNLPRQPAVRATTLASPGSQKTVPRDELATSPSRTSMSMPDRTLRRTEGQGLDWKGFVAAHFPGTGRHNLSAITAYAAYRRPHLAGSSSPPSTSTRKQGEFSEAGASVEAWENEGGASH
jgi:hypothetical protein